MGDVRVPREPRTVAERAVERTLFGCRWLLAPLYLGLVVSLLVLLVKFVQKTVALAIDALFASNTEIITLVLSLIDVCLIASLVLMIMLACYENFVSGFDLASHKFKPS